jgi:hypothetical protein
MKPLEEKFFFTRSLLLLLAISKITIVKDSKEADLTARQWLEYTYLPALHN